MALTIGDAHLWNILLTARQIPPTPSVLEIGEANWFNPEDAPEQCNGDPFEQAKAFYRSMLNYREIIAIDLHGPTARKLDLNYPIVLAEDRTTPGGAKQFEIVINTGTTEHVFDQCQLFKTIHQRCKSGGLMIHSVPWTGFLNHGLYCYQPCFFGALATANRYSVLCNFKYDLENGVVNEDWSQKPEGDVVIYLALRKNAEAAFQVPQQEVYA